MFDCTNRPESVKSSFYQRNRSNEIQIDHERRRVEELAQALARERDMLQVIMENTQAQLVYNVVSCLAFTDPTSGTTK